MLKNSENQPESQIAQEDFNLTANETHKSKKFVFQVYSDNVDFIESLSYQEKNDLANQLFNDYRISSVINQKFNRSINIAKKSVAIFLAVVIGIPLLIYLVSISLDFTKSSYFKMQQNFEKLF